MPRLPEAKWFSIGTAAYILTALALWTVMQANLVAALLAGLLLYSLVDVLAPSWCACTSVTTPWQWRSCRRSPCWD
ncbi:hypothetical protein ACU4GD_24795 [Cupriavidus basilensis]